MRARGAAAALCVAALVVLVASSCMPGSPQRVANDPQAPGSQSQGVGPQSPADSLPAPPDRAPFALLGGGDLVGGDENPLGRRWTWRVPGGLVEVAGQALLDLEEQGLGLRYAGYLDLLGNVWGCLVSGDAWVQAIVVREEEGDGTQDAALGRGGSSLVTVVRLGEGEVGAPAGEGV